MGLYWAKVQFFSLTSVLKKNNYPSINDRNPSLVPTSAVRSGKERDENGMLADNNILAITPSRVLPRARRGVFRRG